MSLPVGTIVKLLKVKDMAGCLGDLYKSIESLNGDYMQQDVNKDAVLKPRAAVSVPLLSLNDALTVEKFYRCSSRCTTYMSNDPNTNCPACGHKISAEMNFVHPKNSSGDTASSISGSAGYVKGLLTYMVMDNLEVKPMSTISAITLLNKFHVKDVASLTEKEVQVGLNEGVAILKASLETRAVLTTVFLGKKVYDFESS